MNICKEVILNGGYTLIVSEKPKAAKAIAEAISRNPIICKENGISFYVIKEKEGYTVVASTAGHMFSLSSKKRSIPVFEYEWVPRWLVDRRARHLRRFYSLLNNLAKRAKMFINACDYDIEGSVIGYMIIKKLGNEERAKRMKFSTLSARELYESYHNLMPLDYPMIEAGLCRHELDWIWGINTSRALMQAYSDAGGRKRILSSGRVQSPTLLEALNRYIDVVTFISPPQFIVTAFFENKKKEKIRTTHVNSPFKEKAEAEKIKADVKGSGKGEVISIDKIKTSEKSPPPFNLSDLQYESSRIYGFSPSYTQKLAENLYLDALISYPRTNSQKLPSTIPHRDIIENISQNYAYSNIAKQILHSNKELRRREGKKEDPAHPAIYPTGKIPKSLKADEAKIYDLIVRRYLATFMEDLVYSKVKFKIKSGKDQLFYGEGIKIEKEGWLSAYAFYELEKPVPEISEGEILSLSKVGIQTYYPDKPRLHTKTSLLKWMESQKIGTEATRAQIIDTLFQRGYLISTKSGITPTKLGIAVALVLKENVSDLVSTQLTRKFEEDMDSIRDMKRTRQEVVAEATKVLKEIIAKMVSRSKQIGVELLKYSETRKSEKCALCDLPTLGAGGLCLIHSEALKRLLDNLENWCKNTGASREEALRKIAKSKSIGKATREIAEAILSREIIID